MSRLAGTAGAVQRAKAEGHRAWLDGDGRGAFVRVVSHEEPGIFYRVSTRPTSPGAGIVFVCEPHSKATKRPLRHAHGHVASTVPGTLPCKHCAVAARRLVREGLAAEIDGFYVAAELADLVTAPADPFAGLPEDGAPC